MLKKLGKHIVRRRVEEVTRQGKGQEASDIQTLPNNDHVGKSDALNIRLSLFLMVNVGTHVFA
jgi:hypothetical protein